MSLATAPETALQRTETHGRRFATALTVSGLLVAASGVVSWHLVQPGVSLVGPTGGGVVVMFAVLGAWSALLRPRGGWRAHLRLASGVLALSLIAPLWAFFGVLSASIALDAAAQHRAQVMVASNDVGCHQVASGSVGRLPAPYVVCMTNPGDGDVVTFTTIDRTRGYAYISSRLDLSWFPHQCARHLEGHWWAFNLAVNPVTGASCPFGYPENPAA